MERREKILLWIVVALVGIVGARYVVMWFVDSIAARRMTIAKLTDDIDNQRFQQAERVNILDYIDGLRERSLPSDLELAQEEYLNWLSNQVTRNFSGVNINKGGVNRHGRDGRFHSISYSVTATGNLQDVVNFLAIFYESGFLHRVNTMSLAPARSSLSGEYNDQLSVFLGIDALALSDAFEKTTLPEINVPRPELTTMAEIIVDRNLFDYNTEPTVAPIRVRDVRQAEALANFRVSASDPDGRPLRFELANAPRGMRIDEQTGEISWTPGRNTPQGETGPISVLVTDVGLPARQVTQEFTVNVTEAAPAVVQEAPPPFDHAQYCKLTAIVDDGLGPMVWIECRTLDRMLKLRASESESIGERGSATRLDFTVVSIDADARSVTLSSGNKTETFRLGDDLSRLRAAATAATGREVRD